LSAVLRCYSATVDTATPLQVPIHRWVSRVGRTAAWQVRAARWHSPGNGLELPQSNLIALNVAGTLKQKLRGKPFITFTSDLKTEADGDIY